MQDLTHGGKETRSKSKKGNYDLGVHGDFVPCPFTLALLFHVPLASRCLGGKVLIILVIISTQFELCHSHMTYSDNHRRNLQVNFDIIGMLLHPYAPRRYRRCNFVFST